MREQSDRVRAEKTPPSRCRVAGSWADDSQFHSQMAHLLHRRLRVVVLIVLLPTALFLLRNWLEPHHHKVYAPITQTVHACLTLALAGLAYWLWSRPAFPLCGLRKLELALLVCMAGFFGWLQWSTLGYSALFESAICESGLDVVRLWIDSTAVRWFFLIVIYGVFIPNTWQRYTTICGLVAVLPLALTPLSAFAHDHVCPDLWEGMFDLVILLGTGLAVGVFGSHRQQVLQQQAFEAQQLGQYRLIRRLGAGGMGEVFLAEHVLLRRPCALKLIRPEQTRDAATLQRFEREVQAMATLTHPNTVEVYDYGRSDDGTFYYVMEYLPGLNLEQLVYRHGPLPAERAIHFLRQVCRALREAHGIGLLHRDIKPSNIIACERGGVYDIAKLLDFGLVQSTGLGERADRITLHGTVLGSPPFMSPEQAAGRADLDARSDVYSLGGVGYFLLTGQPPFLRDTAMEMLLAHAYEEAVPPAELRSGVPADLQAVLMRCLSKKPEGRFASADALEKALAGCAAAGLWTEDAAARWWKLHDTPPETATHEVITVAIAR
jgi:serine/threonine-protein kinase